MESFLTYRNGFARGIQGPVKSGTTLRQQLIGMSAGIKWKILWPDWTMRWHRFLEFIM